MAYVRKLVGLFRSWGRRVALKFLFRLWEYDVVPFGALYSEKYFSNMLRPEAMSDARRFCTVVYNLIEPGSVVDLGAGPGRFLLPFKERGCDVTAVELSEAAIRSSPLSADTYIKHDLREPLHLDRKYDLVLCLEVLEHIPPEKAETAVGSIVSAGRTAVVTAARPGQGGRHHVNERPRSYWLELFGEKGWTADDDIAERIKSSVKPGSLTWLRDNLMVLREGKV